MSFYENMVGTPDALRKALAKRSEQYDGQSKVEFDAILPALDAIIGANLGNVLRVEAAGHASFDWSKGEAGQKVAAECKVKVEVIGPLVE